jgi:hypothetical protein
MAVVWLWFSFYVVALEIQRANAGHGTQTAKRGRFQPLFNRVCNY